MDDKSDTSGGSQRVTRTSLVERAAERIVISSRNAAQQPPRPVLQPAPPPAAGERVLEQALEAAPAPQSGAPAAQEPDDAIALAPLAGAPAPEAPAAEAPAQSADPDRRSKQVTIDIPNLMSRGIITPQTKRTRTVEEFRLIKRMLLSRRWDEGDAPGNTIVVTSALPSEGKTTTAINLAMSIAAEEDLRVLLVDADFIKPDALRQLGVSATKGLIDVLQDPRMDISDVMLRTNIDKLSLIPAGQLHERCTELLASARMDEVIAELAHRYEDRILIFDSPPVLVTTESVALASHMGQVMFVVQAGRTKRESVMSALELIGDRPGLGLVLNRTTARLGNMEFGSYYGSYGYGYGYGYGADRAESAEQKGA
ncbi:MAG: XrtA-associated tyrosine autokinase [Kiloniellaceae bacterium]